MDDAYQNVLRNIGWYIYVKSYYQGVATNYHNVSWPSHLFSKAKVGEVGDKVVRWQDVVWLGQAAIWLSPSPFQTESALTLLLN